MGNTCHIIIAFFSYFVVAFLSLIIFISRSCVYRASDLYRSSWLRTSPAQAFVYFKFMYIWIYAGKSVFVYMWMSLCACLIFYQFVLTNKKTHLKKKSQLLKMANKILKIGDLGFYIIMNWVYLIGEMSIFSLQCKLWIWRLITATLPSSQRSNACVKITEQSAESSDYCLPQTDWRSALPAPAPADSWPATDAHTPCPLVSVPEMSRRRCHNHI